MFRVIISDNRRCANTTMNSIRLTIAAVISALCVGGVFVASAATNAGAPVSGHAAAPVRAVPQLVKLQPEGGESND
jgi:hypothetical protein